MTITLISAFVLILTLMCVLVGACRGYSRGIYDSLIRSAKLICAILITALISFLASNAITDLIYELLEDTDFMVEIEKQLANIGDVMWAFIDAAITPVLFLFVLPFVYATLSIILSAVLKKKMSKFGGASEHEGELAAWYMRDSKVLGAIVGAVFGVILSSVIMSPITGTLNCAHELSCTVKENPVISGSVKIGDDIDFLIEKYSSDGMSDMLHCFGGNVTYRMVSSSTLNDNRFSLVREIRAARDSLPDLIAGVNVIKNIGEAEPYQMDDLLALPKKIKKSETAKSLSADFLSGASGKWLVGEPYMDIILPSVNEVIEPLLSEILYTCTSTTPKTVVRDADTLLRIYVLAAESGILQSGNYEEIMAIISENELIDKICDILDDNPRMRHIEKTVRNMTLNAVASVIDDLKKNITEYQMLMDDLADSLNDLKGMSDEKKLDVMTENALKYMKDYGVDVSDDVARVTAERMLEELSKEEGNITSERLMEFFDSYNLNNAT